ncbi:cyclopropane-fatty-acyl-phospholipid synthase family protein [Herbidospora sp. NBRC 101105]|uniref:SAM-dependent methyltransferase n=1 Tax=Herbidospora sp. NBRC 101105 TaxID=3032195 RepID=UPI0024A451E6|nr:cyclopropane-fatty-acyl-phospholipid synthase family protein [Herbidospora sp. NBRC 101105]GLX92789.1 cyclopropane-fatty-acyl-phospholipid synthase [Herbidospora sp. NBRC 101105]
MTHVLALTPPRSPLRVRVVRQLFRNAVTRLPLRVRMPDGELLGDPSGPLMRVVRAEDFFSRVGADGLIGFGEAYMAGDWEADDLAGVLTVMATQLASLIPAPLQRLRGVWARRHPRSEEGTVENARRNVQRHYDLSNDLFAQFLDPSMTYSAALFRGEATWENLEEAQHAKIDRLLDETRVGPGSAVMEIGTGWGALAIRAARRGAVVRTITLSAEQQAFARERVAAAGLSDRVSVELCDYRQAAGSYDAVLSVEMIEAVGERYWPVFFATLDRLLAPGGRVGLQAITMPHDRMVASRHTYTWIQKYIFPGGLLPSVTAIEQNLGPLRVAGHHEMGGDYAETLRLWRERYCSRRAEISRLGFDELFHRMWIFYLAYSEAGFRSGYLNVRQLVLERSGS